MENKIGEFENMELIDRIVLNGRVDRINTNDDNDSTIGITSIIRKVTFKGEELVDENRGFALTKEMRDKIGWGQDTYASIRFVTGKTPIDPTRVEETIIECFMGNIQSKYSHHYSDLTGYLWTDEDFKVGGHDIREILYNHIGEYIHMEIELYQQKTSIKPAKKKSKK